MNHAKSDWYSQIKNIQEIYLYVIVEMLLVQKIQLIPKKRMGYYYTCILYMMETQSSSQIFAKNNFVANEIMGNILGWGQDWCMKRLKSDTSIKEMSILFSHRHTVEATRCYYKCKKKYPNARLHCLPHWHF